MSFVVVRPTYQTYAWGKKSNDSIVYKLINNHHESESIDDNNNTLRFAELWVGTHSSSPSKVNNSGDLLLSDWISMNSEKVGTYNNQNLNLNNGQLPFLLKVLSVDMALSIQAHPDSLLAAKLHNNHPNIYKDPQHKPELICALNDFEGLCQFRPSSEIIFFAQNVPELKMLLHLSTTANNIRINNNNNNNDNNNFDIRSLFASLMLAPNDAVKQYSQSLYDRLITAINSNVNDSIIPNDLVQLFLRLFKDFPNDVGIFCVFFLNYVHLKPGESLFLAANEPHAYLYGDGVEIMACSDNVVRAGLTPKHKDVSTLLSMLTYNCGFPQILTGESVTTSNNMCNYSVYRPPVAEFQLLRVILRAGGEISLNPGSFANVVLMISGNIKISSYGNSNEQEQEQEQEQEHHHHHHHHSNTVSSGDTFLLPIHHQFRFHSNSNCDSLFFIATIHDNSTISFS